MDSKTLGIVVQVIDISRTVCIRYESNNIHDCAPKSLIGFMRISNAIISLFAFFGAVSQNKVHKNKQMTNQNYTIFLSEQLIFFLS